MAAVAVKGNPEAMTSAHTCFTLGIQPVHNMIYKMKSAMLTGTILAKG